MYTQKISIMNWSYRDPDDLEALGFFRPNPQEMPRFHGEYNVTDSEKWAILKALYNAGFNVQMRHDRSGVTNIETILVDKGTFRIS